MAHIKPPSAAELAKVKNWEAFLNQDGLKYQLSARYIYEHWFLAHIYFSDSQSPNFLSWCVQALLLGKILS